MKRLYLLLAAAGLVLPYYFFALFLLDNGFDLPLFLEQLLANDISTFFTVNLVITAIVFLLFSYVEARKHQIKNWWGYVVATLVVGPSFSFPYFLFFRESRLEAQTAEA